MNDSLKELDSFLFEVESSWAEEADEAVTLVNLPKGHGLGSFLVEFGRMLEHEDSTFNQRQDS